jgi:hypothetical protein
MDNNNLCTFETDLVEEREYFIISLKNACDKFSKDLFNLILEDEKELSESKYVHAINDADNDITECVEILSQDLVKEFSKTIDSII